LIFEVPLVIIEPTKKQGITGLPTDGYETADDARLAGDGRIRRMAGDGKSYLPVPAG